MAVLSYKEFMEEVRIRLETLSTEDLRNLILGWARHTAFKSEITQALQTSGLFDVKTPRKGR